MRPSYGAGVSAQGLCCPGSSAFALMSCEGTLELVEPPALPCVRCRVKALNGKVHVRKWVKMYRKNLQAKLWD